MKKEFIMPEIDIVPLLDTDIVATSGTQDDQLPLIPLPSSSKNT